MEASVSMVLMDAQSLEAAEAIIERGQRTFLEVGRALMEIRDGRGYRLRGFTTFEAYIEGHWGWSRQHGYRVVDAAELVFDLQKCHPGVTFQIPSERHARELLAVPVTERPALVQDLGGDLSRYSTRALRAEIIERRTQRVRDARARLLASTPPTPMLSADQCWIGVADAADLPDCYLGSDLLVTSPPYALDVDYGAAADPLDYPSYLQRASGWARELYRVAHPEHGRLCLNVPLDRSKGSREPVYADWLQVLRAAGWRYESTIVWKEDNVSNHQARGSVGSPNAPHAVAPVEMVLVMYRGSWNRGEPQRASDIQELDWIDWLSKSWEFAGEHRYRVGHPAPFPIELPRRCIQLFSFPGDVVADPFLGSGTSGVAALQHGRRFRGSDIDPQSVDTARARIARAIQEVA